MDAYTASSWRPPTQPVGGSILKAKKKRLNLHSQHDKHKSVTLQTIREDHPLPSATGGGDVSKLRKEIAALRTQCAALEAQRNDALEALDQVTSAPKGHVSDGINTYVAQIKHLEAQRNDAFEALDLVVSAPPPQSTKYIARIHELEAQQRILEDRCKTFSAWAEQKRLESSRHKETCDQLNEALTDFYAKHEALYAQHKELEAQLAALSATSA